MQILRKMFFFMFILTGLVTLQACDTNDGPLEEAAEDVEDAVEEAGDKIEDATD